MNFDLRRPGAPAGEESRNPGAGDDMVVPRDVWSVSSMLVLVGIFKAC